MNSLIYMIHNFMFLMITIICAMVAVAFFTLYERKILSYSHYRKGPNKVSFLGIMQPFSDAMKLLSKENFFPLKSNLMFYLMSPMFMFLISMSLWLIYPFKTNTFKWNMNILYFLSVMSIGVYGLMISGWSSNSAFSMLGAIRSIAQSISYEINFVITLILPLIILNSLNLNNLMYLNKYMSMFMLLWPSMIILFISMIAEINRTPFDLSEGESELVSGFNVEYSGSMFTLIFLAEYSSIMIMMFIFSWICFNSNPYYPSLYFMTLILCHLIIWMRVTLPRMRFDILMTMCWLHMLPHSLIIFISYMIFMKMPSMFIIN